MNQPRLIFALAVTFACLTACATTESAHQNFNNIMNAHVGKNADSPSARLWRDPKARVLVRILPNGNIEEGYTQYATCRYFFEINQTTREIVSWRYEGSNDKCVVWP